MSASRQPRRRKNAVALPRHANADVHQAIMKKLAGMTAEQIFATAVKSGIYTKSGKLKKPYAPERVAQHLR